MKQCIPENMCEGEHIFCSRALNGKDHVSEHPRRDGMWWEKELLHEMCLQMQNYLTVLHVTEFMRYVWLGPWSQVSQLRLGKEERLQNLRSQHRCGQ